MPLSFGRVSRGAICRVGARRSCPSGIFGVTKRRRNGSALGLPACRVRTADRGHGLGGHRAEGMREVSAGSVLQQKVSGRSTL